MSGLEVGYDPGDGDLLGRDDSTIRYGVHQLRQRIKQSWNLQDRFETLKRRIFA